MVGGLFGDGNLDDAEIAALLSALLAELPTAAAPRRQEILNELYELCWKAGPRAAAAISTLIGWPLSAGKEAEDAVCYALKYCAPIEHCTAAGAVEGCE